MYLLWSTLGRTHIYTRMEIQSTFLRDRERERERALEQHYKNQGMMILYTLGDTIVDNDKHVVQDTRPLQLFMQGSWYIFISILYVAILHATAYCMLIHTLY